MVEVVTSFEFETVVEVVTAPAVVAGGDEARMIACAVFSPP